MTTFETLQHLLVEEFKHNPADLTPEATLADLGIDSLELVDLIFKIEDRFGLKVKDDVPQALLNLQDVAAYIDQLLAQQTSEPAAQLEKHRSS